MSSLTDFGKVEWGSQDLQRSLLHPELWKSDSRKGLTGPTSNSTPEDLRRLGIDPDSTAEQSSDTISIGSIPESEEKAAKAWYDLFNRLGEIDLRLDPRRLHKDGQPYDPIDLTFRIVDALKAIRQIRSNIAERFQFTDPSVRSYSATDSL